MKKIIAISGSIKKHSSNTQILKTLAAMADADILFRIYEGIHLLPHFNPDEDTMNSIPHPQVKAFREELQTADGFVFSTPEYAHGVPGVLKNALDWLVSSGEFVDKPVATISASPMITGGKMAHDSLRATLKMMSAEITEQTMVSISQVNTKFDGQGNLQDKATKTELENLLAALISETARN